MLLMTITAVSDGTTIQDPPTIIASPLDTVEAMREIGGYLAGVLAHLQTDTPTRLTIDAVKVLKTLEDPKGKQ